MVIFPSEISLWLHLCCRITFNGIIGTVGLRAAIFLFVLPPFFLFRFFWSSFPVAFCVNQNVFLCSFNLWFSVVSLLYIWVFFFLSGCSKDYNVHFWICHSILKVNMQSLLADPGALQQRRSIFPLLILGAVAVGSCLSLSVGWGCWSWEQRSVRRGCCCQGCVHTRRWLEQSGV